MVQKIVVGNLKGGVGKTTTATQIAFNLAYNKHYKTLLVDLDLQANASTIMLKTKLNFNSRSNTHAKSSLMKAVQHEDLSKARINIYSNLVDKLDLLASSADFYNFSRYMEEKFSNYEDRIHYFKKLTDNLFNEYDYVVIDTPPTISLITDCALYLSDWVLIVTQTQQNSLDGALTYLQYLQNTIIDQYNAPTLDSAGLLRVMLDKKSSVDKAVMQDIIDEFGEDNVLPTVVTNMSRLKRFGRTGITTDSFFDKKALDVYNNVTNELLERIK